MSKRNLTLDALQPHDIERFLRCPVRKRLKRSTRNHYRVRLQVYLDWLYENRHLRFDPRCLREKPKQLSEVAERFLESLTTIKSSSCRSYKSTLSTFHDWLDDRALPLAALKRRHIIRWLRHLKGKGLQPATFTTLRHCGPPATTWTSLIG